MKTWEYNGEKYQAKRDSGGFIYISEYKGKYDDGTECWYQVGNGGYDWCLRFRQVEELAKELGVYAGQTNDEDAGRPEEERDG